MNLNSRSLRREEKFLNCAQQGKFEARVNLFPEEAKKLIKKGFTIEWLNWSRFSAPAIVSWETAWPLEEIPIEVMNYIHGSIAQIPIEINKNLNWAQKLFILTKKSQ